MPATLTDDPSHFPDVVAPSPGDDRKDVSITPALQALADRTRQNKTRLDGIAPTDDGVRALRTLPSIAALQATTDHDDGTFCIVADGGGLFRYDAASGDTPLANVVVKPDEYIVSGLGRWLLQGRAIYNAPNGVAQCDSTGRLAAARVRNGVVAADSALGSYTGSTTATITGATLSLTDLEVGDLILMEYSAKVVPTAGEAAEIEAVVVEPTTSESIVSGPNRVARPASDWQLDGVLVGGSAFFRVVHAGTHDVKLVALPAGHTTNYFNAVLNVRAVRP